ncbi:MAG: endonuclease MutS2 [Anaerolineales bacterium]
MHEKALFTLELPKVLDQLSHFTSFSAGEDLALTLEPTADAETARRWVAEVTEARILLEERGDQFTLGGVRDVREAALSTQRGAVLDTSTLLDIRSTLRRATTLRRMLTNMRGQYPLLARIVDPLEECSGLQHEIARVISEDGHVLDSASTKLAIIRRDLKQAFDRLQSKLNSIINNSNNAQYLQEQLITQRNGRYVIPVKADFKGRIPGIVHDQSSSGATLWVEPLKTVEINNDYRDLQLQEEKEIRRILRELCELVAHESEYIVRTVDGLAYIDLIFAKAQYAAALRANAPKLVEFQPREDAPYHPGVTLKLNQARHPLLSGHVVPIDLELDPDTYCLVITGPNTGGKTVALKTVGLMVLMAQCGMHLPADPGTTLSVFKDVYADIGDEQSIEQSLSTFSSHMTNIIRIIEQAGDQSLVILDEVGAGTDPAEGSALARALLNRFVDSGITTLVTTHHPELKLYSHDKRGVRNASVEFDLETLAPTYRLMVGLPGRSNALAIATRLGLPEDIIDDARSMVATEDLVADDLLDEITQTREDTRIAYARAAAAEAEAQQLRAELRQRLDELETERRDVLAEARRKADYELRELRREIKRLRKDMEGARQPLDALRKLERATDNLDIEIEVPAEPATQELDDDGHKLRLGDSVWVPALKAQGQITELSASDAEVAVGQLRVRAKLADLEYRKPEETKQRKRKKSADTSYERGKSPGLELDLRGSRVEDAVMRVEEYIDAAYMASLPWVRIIHGKGTGALRQAVRDSLKNNALIEKYQPAAPKEGGDGVTVVHLSEQF